MDIPNTSFFLRFGLASYSAVFFFTVGLSFALACTNHLKYIELMIIFCLIAIALNFSFKSEPLQTRLIIAIIWTSILWIGFRVGKKLIKR